MHIDTDSGASPQELDRQAERGKHVDHVIMRASGMCEALVVAGFDIEEKDFEYDPAEVNIPDGTTSRGKELKFSTRSEEAMDFGHRVLLTIHLWLPQADSPGLRDAVIACRIEDDGIDNSLDIHIMHGKMGAPVSINRTDLDWYRKDNTIGEGEAAERFDDMLVIIAEKLIHRMNSSLDEDVQRRLLCLVLEMINHNAIERDTLSEGSRETLAAAEEILT